MIYRIKINGYLDAGWDEWFNGMHMDVENCAGGSLLTTLTGPVPDQSCLRGILNRIWDLNLEIISVIQLEIDPSSA